MTENQTRLPMPRALAEASVNPVRQNPGMAPPSEVPVKRKLQQPTILQPESKILKPNMTGKSIQTLAGRGPTGSGIARPSSAASGRHGATKSIDGGLMRRAVGTRPLSRTQAPRTRPASALDSGSTSAGKPESHPDSTIRSMTHLPSSSCPRQVALARQNLRDVSVCSGMSSLITNFQALSVTPTATGGSRRKPELGPIRESSKICLQSNCKTRLTTPRKRLKKIPVTPGGFLTIESNTRVEPAFDIETKLTDITSLMTTVTDQYGSWVEEKGTMTQMIEMYKSKVEELEALRRQLEDTNSAMRNDLEETRTALTATRSDGDESRRRYLNEIDDMRRKHMDELDGSKRDYRDEVDALRRDYQHSKDSAAASAQESISHADRRHQTELQELKRELMLTLEEERQARKREVQALQDAACSAQRSAESGQQQHTRELQERDGRLTQLSGQLERERETIDDLRKQLRRAIEQTAELDNATRSLKAQVEFLKSDSKSQTQAFADLEQQTQDALRETEEYRCQLRKEESTRRKLLNQIQDLKGNIRVFCRVRPPLPTERGTCASISFPDKDSDCKAIDVLGLEEKSSLGKITTKTHAFSFDRSFDQQSHNAEIFTELSELVAAVCGGSFNTCVFSYGQTGSGKTYTMASPDGMIARAVTQIFDTAKDLISKGWRYTITGSFVEVYNENINDLLGNPDEFDKHKHEIRHNPQTLTTEISDVVDVRLDSSDHFTSVLDQAMRNRSIAATKANERSSRSHSVCILKLTGQNELTGETCRSTLNLVDLAGSERLAHSQATGNRLKETQNINKSLSCLADVIAALGEAKEGSHIPYRNSKLTYLLQNSLGGNSKTLMFVMISPLQEHLSETLSSLSFATKVNNTRLVRKPKR